MNVEVKQCPYCGGNEFIEGRSEGHGGVFGENFLGTAQPIYHQICRRCGSIVRSYIENPEKLLKKKNRRKEPR